MGRTNLMSSNDTPDLGRDEYADFIGVHVADPRVSARARVGSPYDVDSGRAKFITTDGGYDAGMADMPDARILDDWRDALNPQSPAFWLLLFILAIVGFMQFRVQLGGPRGARAALG